MHYELFLVIENSHTILVTIEVLTLQKGEENANNSKHSCLFIKRMSMRNYLIKTVKIVRRDFV